jgi:hypothetical protein
MNSSNLRSRGIQYSESTFDRARQAVRCSPFYMQLLADMRSQSVSLNAITDSRGAYNRYTRQPLTELTAENELLWLISVGILRREVDGQGLTDSFRLTPLGRQLLEDWLAQGRPDWRANLLEYLRNAANRWLKLPSWFG